MDRPVRLASAASAALRRRSAAAAWRAAVSPGLAPRRVGLRSLDAAEPVDVAVAALPVESRLELRVDRRDLVDLVRVAAVVEAAVPSLLPRPPDDARPLSRAERRTDVEEPLAADAAEEEEPEVILRT